MESEHAPEANAREAQDVLALVAGDRGALARRAAKPRWYYPALALATAAIVGSPGAATPGAQSMLIAAACVGLVFIESAYRKATGLSITRPAGPRSLAVVVVQGVLVVALLVASVWLDRVDQDPWVAAMAVGGFVTMLAGGLLYDRVYDQELRHGR